MGKPAIAMGFKYPIYLIGIISKQLSHLRAKTRVRCSALGVISVAQRGGSLAFLDYPWAKKSYKQAGKRDLKLRKPVSHAVE
jgi:hypothetical protein